MVLRIVLVLGFQSYGVGSLFDSEYEYVYESHDSLIWSIVP